MDALYTLIMQRIPPRMLRLVHLLLTQLCTFPLLPHDYLNAFMGSNLLGVSLPEFRRICSQITSVIYFHGRTDPVDLRNTIHAQRLFTDFANEHNFGLLSFREVSATLDLGGKLGFYHKSFDFLCDPERSGPYCTLSEELQNTIF
jgi:hypothetical protein